MWDTGFYASPDGNGTRVHVHDREAGRPLCGVRVTGRFQWCSTGINDRYLECARCRALVDRMRALAAARKERA